jgi:hypothetical protein
VKQLDRDQVFGFPPLLGQRNLPHPAVRKRSFWREDVDQLIARAKARTEAASRGIQVNGTMQLDEIQTAIREDDFQKHRRGPLKLVLVDSSKLGPVSSRSEGLRKRRQSAPAATEAKHNAKTATSSSGKRSLGGMTDGVKDSSPDDPEEIQPRKKRRTTLKLITKPPAPSPTREKRHGISKGPWTPASAKPTPPDRRSALKRVQSEKAAKGRSTGQTPSKPPSKSAAAEPPRTVTRAKRRHTGPASLASSKSMPHLMADS